MTRSENIIFFKKAFFGLFLNFQQFKTKGERENKNRKEEGKKGKKEERKKTRKDRTWHISQYLKATG